MGAPAASPARARGCGLPRLGLIFPDAEGSAEPWTLDLRATESYLTPDTRPNAPANSYCPGIEAPAATGFTSNLTLIGNTAWHSSVVIFDRSYGRVGFAPQAHCDTAVVS